MFKRPGSFLVKCVHRYRQLMPYLMPTRNESVVYYDSYVYAKPILDFLEKVKDAPYKITLTHVLVHACAMGIYKHPTMNQYIMGYRLYQREKAEISFSLKKEKVSKAPIKVVKLVVEKNETLLDVARRVHERLNIERSDKKTYTDKEIDLVTCLPCFVLRFMVWLLRCLDSWNLLPASFIAKDPLYASIFIANLGSIGMDAGFHHLYEYGTIPLFLMVGKVQEMPVVVDGKVEVRQMLHLRFTYDERIDDGLSSGLGINSVVEMLEHPDEHFHLQELLASFNHASSSTPVTESPSSSAPQPPTE